MSISLETVNKDGVVLKVSNDTLIITGAIISSNPGEFMDPFLKKYHEQIVQNDIKSINLDVTELSFLNSSGIRSLADWILLLEELPDDKKYSIKIKFNKKYLWQDTSMSTLVYLNPALISKSSI